METPEVKILDREQRQERAEQLLEKCREILRKEKILVSEEIVCLKINDRIRSRFGSCRKVQEGRKHNWKYEIEISGNLMNTEDKAIETVMLHELLHTCYGCMNHGKRWKQYAKKLNDKYGYEIKAASKYEAFGLEDPGSKEQIHYRIQCVRCGMEITRKRKCKLVVNTDRYRCGKCGGKLEIQ